MKAAPFLNLPMQPRRLRIVDLHAVDAEVVLPGRWVFGVDQRQRDEGPTVFMPGRQRGQSIEAAGSIDDLLHRTARYGSCPELEEISHQRSMLPELSAIRRQQRLCDAY